MDTVNVRVIDSQTDGIKTLNLPATMTVRQLLEANKINLDQMTVRIRIDGESVQYDLDDELINDSTVTVTPTNIKGAQLTLSDFDFYLILKGGIMPLFLLDEKVK